MSEYELLTLLSETQNSIVGLLQWWASISLALMVVGHFAGDKLTWPLVISILTLYTGFTILIWLLNQQRGADLENLFRELQSLETLTQVGSAKANSESENPIAFVVAGLLSYLGTYLAAVAYLLWRFITARKHRSRRSGMLLCDHKPAILAGVVDG